MNKLLKHAFTLIELLVVIAIIGILSGLIVVTMGGVTQKATIAKAQVFSNSLRNSLILNLVSEWKLDENTGTTTTDSWSGGNAGTLIGVTHLPVWKTNSDCFNGSCIQFDGIDDYVNIPNADNLNIAGNLTIEAWIKFNSITQTNQTIVAKNTSSSNGYWLFYNFSVINNLKFDFIGVNNNSAYSTITPELNKWTHVVVLRDGTDVLFYINGVFDNETAVGGTVNPISANPLRISSRSDSTSYFFNGLIDNIRIYNTIISASQIQEQYYTGLNRLLANGNINIVEYNQRIKEISYK